MNAGTVHDGKRPRRRTTPPSEVLERAPRLHGLQRRQTAVIRDLIRLDIATPHFETEGLTLIRNLLEEEE